MAAAAEAEGKSSRFGSGPGRKKGEPHALSLMSRSLDQVKKRVWVSSAMTGLEKIWVEPTFKERFEADGRGQTEKMSWIRLFLELSHEKKGGPIEPS